MKKRIGIDARFYGSLGKGLGRYTEKLIEHLEQQAPAGWEFFIFLRRENYDEYVPANPAFRKVLADYGWYGFGEQVLFPILLLSYRLDLVHFPHFNVPVLYPKKFVVTIHDLILLHFPTVRNTVRTTSAYRLKFLAYKLVIACAIGRSELVLTVSKFTAADIAKEYPRATGKILVTYEGVDERCFFVPEQEAREVFRRAGMLLSERETPSLRDILPTYFLYVGNAYPHKNLEAFLPLAKRFPDVRFVLVGKDDFFYRRLGKKIAREGMTNILLASFVPDRELSVFYRYASGYVFPSLYEGFGLPPLEAMAYGIPVLASDRGSLPEILGDAALLFDPDGRELRMMIGDMLSDRSVSEHVVKKGFERLPRYRWAVMAEETIAAYAGILE
jgi:glycosyltransferase involved in cell wall biosynthesis